MGRDLGGAALIEGCDWRGAMGGKRLQGRDWRGASGRARLGDATEGATGGGRMERSDWRGAAGGTLLEGRESRWVHAVAVFMAVARKQRMFAVFNDNIKEP